MSLRISDARLQERSQRLRPRPSHRLWRRAPSLSRREREGAQKGEGARAGLSCTIAALLLASCGQPKPDDATLTRTETAQRAAAGEVLCARGTEPLARVCQLDRTQTSGGLILTISYPDGGFRRLLVTTDGRGIVAADGAERAMVATAGALIDVTIGSDHIRLPATIAPHAP